MGGARLATKVASLRAVGDQKVGCISAVNYNHSFGFMGFYIVVPEFRGSGYGLELWKRGIAHHGDRCIGLDGVVDQQENYKKSGFKLHYRNIRFKGKGGASNGHALDALEDVSFEQLLKYDAHVFGLERKAFLEKWVAMPNARGWAKTEGGKVVGYGLIRQCDEGHKIGPLFSDSEEIAREIFRGLVTLAEEEPYFLDVPEVNRFALQIADDFGMEKVFETARMYTKKPPEVALDKVFGVTTFELG